MYIIQKPTPEQRKALGNTLRQARHAQGLTQEQVAEHLGCSRRWVTSIELGKSNPNWLDVIHLIVLLEVDPVLLCREVERNVAVSSL